MYHDAPYNHQDVKMDGGCCARTSTGV